MDQLQPDISFSSPYFVSRRHLEIAQQKDKYRLIDFVSKYGKRLNEKLLK